MSASGYICSQCNLVTLYIWAAGSRQLITRYPPLSRGGYIVPLCETSSYVAISKEDRQVMHDIYKWPYL